MRRRLLAATAALIVAAAPGVQAPLAPDAIRPVLVLPPPPPEGGPEATAEIEELHRIQASRTPAEIARAKRDDETKTVSIFNEAVGPGIDLTGLPATAALFALVRAEEKRDADQAKETFRRKRPWIVDSSLGSCSRDDEPDSSYPSGHTTMGYAMAAILARLVPDRAPQIMARAADYAHNRLVCEVHFRSDIVAGQALGMVVAERLMADAAFRAQFDAAAAELARR